MNPYFLRVSKAVHLPIFKRLSSICSSHPSAAVSAKVCFSSHASASSRYAVDQSPGTSIRHQLSHGQPTYESHPHVFTNPLDVMPGISREELKDRRTRLCSMALRSAQETSGEERSHLIIIPAASKKYMTENIPYPFRQNSNFFYLTGSYDPEALLVLAISSGGEQIHSVFLNDPDPVSDLWDGRKTSPTGAIEHLGLDRAYLLSSFDSYIRDFAVSSERKFLFWCEDRNFFERIRTHFLSSAETQPIQSPKGLLHSLRVVKSPGEIELMRTSAQIASDSFKTLISYCSHNMHFNKSLSEHQVWAKMDYECRVRGADRLAYPPVVASGARANIIHYVHNKNLCGKDELCLVDAGCEYFGYCSDITRTFPVTGKFTNDHQRSLYELVLDIQEKLIKKVEPGMTLDRLFRSMGPLMLQGLQELGIIDKSIIADSGLGPTDLTLRFCQHHVSHYLGMDVHDTPSIERHSALQSGMIVTVEPGIYIQVASPQKDLLTKVGREFDGIGIRIEDDVLVTPDGQDVLTAPCPKSIEEIEHWGQIKSSF